MGYTAAASNHSDIPVLREERHSTRGARRPGVPSVPERVRAGVSGAGCAQAVLWHGRPAMNAPYVMLLLALQPEPAPPPPEPREASKGGQDRHCGRIADGKEKRACKKRRRTRRRSFPHRGLILEAHGGGIGCVGEVCRRNDANPGGSFGAMVAGNLFGFVELGADINWGSMSLAGAGNPLEMHGVDPGGFARKTAGAGDDVDQLESDLGALAVDGGRANVFSASGTVRVHFLPYGRWEAFVGSGVGFSRWRARFDTDDGEIETRVPAVYIPAIAGFGFYPLRFMVINLQFQYQYAAPAGLALDSPGYEASARRSRLEDGDDATTVDWGGDMPQYWNLVLGLKFRI